MNFKSSHLWGASALLLLLILTVSSFRTTHADRAEAFILSLTKAQKARVVHDFKDMSRTSWTYLPASMMSRAGLPIGELSEQQRSLFLGLLRGYLSEKGYSKVMDIMALEKVLYELENENPMRDAGAYYIAIYGKPVENGVWGWSFEGHHISLNFTISDGHISTTPRFLGTNPAEYSERPHPGVRILGQEEDLAFELLNSLDSDQKEEAIFQELPFADIVTSTSVEVQPLTPVGIGHNQLNKEQQKMLFNLIKEYLSTIPTELAISRMGVIREENPKHIYFGWAGATERGKGHYYRVQGKSFLIEFDNTQNNANHVHTVWRDFDGDFGRDLLREHYAREHK